MHESVRRVRRDVQQVALLGDEVLAVDDAVHAAARDLKRLEAVLVPVVGHGSALVVDRVREFVLLPRAAGQDEIVDDLVALVVMAQPVARLHHPNDIFAFPIMIFAKVSSSIFFRSMVVSFLSNRRQCGQ